MPRPRVYADMVHLVPHALILLAIVAWLGGRLDETPFLVLFVLGHLVVPLWSAAVARRATRLRAIVIGPGTVIAVHAVALVITFLLALRDPPEGSWLTLYLVMLWAISLVAYTAYCAATFALVTRLSKRS